MLEKIIIVGAGGIGGWLGRLAKKTFPKVTDIDVYDADRWEKHNVDRQFVSKIGEFKADTLVADLGVGKAVNEWFNAMAFAPFMQPVEGERLIFACVDNHPARCQVLDAIDQGQDNSKDYAIICGNEYTSASACIYKRDFYGSRRDPRVRYPEMLNDHSGDPSSPCTGQAAEKAPQLATSNYMAAGFGIWLAWYWLNVYSKLNVEAAQLASPIEVMSSNCGMSVTRLQDL